MGRFPSNRSRWLERPSVFASRLIRRRLLNVRQGRCTGVMSFFPTQEMWQQAPLFNGRVEKVLTRYKRPNAVHGHVERRQSRFPCQHPPENIRTACPRRTFRSVCCRAFRFELQLVRYSASTEYVHLPRKWQRGGGSSLQPFALSE